MNGNDALFSAIFPVAIIVIPIVLGVLCAVTIMAKVLNKSNNLGATGNVSPTVKGNVKIYDRIDNNGNCPLQDEIHNPVILAHMGEGSGSSYSSENSKLSLEEQIDNADFGNISWHK